MMMMTVSVPHSIGSSVQSMFYLDPFFRFSPVGPLQVVFILLFRLGFLDAWFATNDVLLMMIPVQLCICDDNICDYDDACFVLSAIMMRTMMMMTDRPEHVTWLKMSDTVTR